MLASDHLRRPYSSVSSISAEASEIRAGWPTISKTASPNGGFVIDHHRTDDVRIEQGTGSRPDAGHASSTPSAEHDLRARRPCDILRGAGDRLLVVVGPCSIRDHAALDFAGRLKLANAPA
jgi:hypothetical protein